MSDRRQFLVRFWGVRGSYPTPGARTLRHGGNTSCVEMQVGRQRLIFDAGSGIIRLGNQLLQEKKVAQKLEVALFITHGHGDHLIGFPFFAPLFDSQTSIHLFGPQLAGRGVEQLVTSVMSPPYFPVDLRKLPSHREFHTIADEQCITWQKGADKPLVSNDLPEIQFERKHADGEVKVYAKFTQSHPLNGAIIYRVEYQDRRVVYATDVEWSGGCEPEFLRFIEGADLLIHDAQYTTRDYKREKQGYGHSTIDMAVEAAREGKVKTLILFHHEPTYDDDQLDVMEAEAQKQFPSTRSASEGMEIDLLE